jgi:hypothetical protein
MIEIKNNYQQIELDIKRFYPPCDIVVTCPECGYINEIDDYISFPNVNEVIEYGCWCPACSHEWSEEVKLIVGMVVGTGE